MQRLYSPNPVAVGDKVRELYQGTVGEVIELHPDGACYIRWADGSTGLTFVDGQGFHVSDWLQFLDLRPADEGRSLPV